MEKYYINGQQIDPFRKVGPESSRSFKDKLENGFFKKYMSGIGIEPGYKGSVEGSVPILPDCTGIDLDTKGYDGLHLPYPNNSIDYVYSSHVLEHIIDYKSTLKEWYRVLKINGYMVIIVPHFMLYEKKLSIPSKWNGDHKRFYSPATLLKEIEESLVPNSYRVRMCEDNDKGFDYNIGLEYHSNGAYEITLILEKIALPKWELK